MRPARAEQLGQLCWYESLEKINLRLWLHQETSAWGKFP